jgi:hypothetical protein
METFTLSHEELHRPGLVKAACAGRLTGPDVNDGQVDVGMTIEFLSASSVSHIGDVAYTKSPLERLAEPAATLGRR